MCCVSWKLASMFTLSLRVNGFQGCWSSFPSSVNTLPGTDHPWEGPLPFLQQLTRPFSSACAWTQSCEQWLPHRRCGHTLYFSLVSSFPAVIKKTLGFQEWRWPASSNFFKSPIIWHCSPLDLGLPRFNLPISCLCITQGRGPQQKIQGDQRPQRHLASGAGIYS